ncbi:hypothetical protein ACJRO7_019363 [Eucalyptus globulus]|uniref:Aluminum-activated malate transporter n=1 Tax=Eucalyptus globulus TaxID=34317 RepID=A0ABD3KCS7_EUCGL
MRFSGKVVGVMMWEMGKEDPRRVIHSIKCAVSPSQSIGQIVIWAVLLSSLNSLQGLNRGYSSCWVLGISNWAVITVLIVLEFTAGATLRKGLNRGIGTVLAGLFQVIVEHLWAHRPTPRAVFMGWTVFVIGAAATCMRFVPLIKKLRLRGPLFIVTFSMILVSNYHVDNTTKMMRDRFYTIAIGCGMSFLESAHPSNLISGFLTACVGEYFHDAQTKEIRDELSKDSINQNCITVLDSKCTDETMALYASWEPRYRGNCNKSPWQQYVKFGVALCRFGSTVMALYEKLIPLGAIINSRNTPPSLRDLLKDQCTRLAGEVSKVLVELANSRKNRCQFSLEMISSHLHLALQDLNTALQSQPQILSDSINRKDSRISLATSFGGNSSPLRESKTARPPEQVHDIQKVSRPQRSKLAVARLDHVIEEAEELGRIARFKEHKAGDEVVVTSERRKSDFVGNHFPPSGTE